jgi:putative DNA primase/helicase
VNGTPDPLPSESPDQGDLFDAMSRLKLDLNDRDNGRRLVGALKSSAIYVVGRGWGVWDTRRFNFEGGTSRILALAGCLQRLHEEEAAALKNQPVPDWQVDARVALSGEARDVAARKIAAERSASRGKYAKGCGNVARIKAALEMAVAAFMVDGQMLDSDRSVIQFENGTLNLDAIATIPDAEDPDERLARWDAALVPHSRAGLPTRLASCAFDPRAEAPEFLRFVALIQPNEGERRYLQRCMGMLVGGRVGEIFLVLLGKGGTGKSTVVKAVEAVAGDYLQPCRIEMFLEHRNSGGTGPTPEEAVLPGARIYTAQEPPEGATLDAGKLKGLTDGSKRQANPKNKDLFNFRPVGVPVLQMNKLSRVNDASDGFWRRIHPIQFKVQIKTLPEAEQRSEPFMAAAIEREKSGILNWLLEGYAEFRAIGLAPPEGVERLKGSLRAMADPVGQFLTEKTSQGAGLRVRTSDLHKAFAAWSEAEGEKPMGAKAFTANMLALDFEKYQSNNWYWRGLGLTDLGLLDGSEGSP